MSTDAILAYRKALAALEAVNAAIDAGTEAERVALAAAQDALKARRDIFADALASANEGVDAAKTFLMDTIRSGGTKTVAGEAGDTYTLAVRATIKPSNEELAVRTIIANAGPDSLPRLLSPNKSATDLIKTLFGDEVEAKAAGWTVQRTEYLVVKEAKP